VRTIRLKTVKICPRTSHFSLRQVKSDRLLVNGLLGAQHVVRMMWAGNLKIFNKINYLINIHARRRDCRKLTAWKPNSNQ